MKKSTFVAMILGTVGGILFALDSWMIQCVRRLIEDTYTVIEQEIA